MLLALFFFNVFSSDIVSQILETNSYAYLTDCLNILCILDFRRFYKIPKTAHELP